jgi:hypothetical protein
LVQTLSLQALAALGQVPDPAGKATTPRLDLAKHTIDMLGMLEEKTRGNLTSDEAALLERMLHELRLAYVTLCGRPAASPPPEPPATSASPPAS